MKHLLFAITITILLHASFSIALADWFLPQTGQTTCYDSSGNALPSCVGTGQDGDTLAGQPWPNPRFTDDGNGTVTDNLTGLVWLKNANCFGTLVWETALDSASTLASGACGLSDGSTAGQWRLPSVIELESLVNEEQANPYTWLNTQGFSAVQGSYYWSSNTDVYSPAYIWVVGMDVGYVVSGYVSHKYYYNYVWPVRGGQ